jgi:hypothetical protein
VTERPTSVNIADITNAPLSSPNTDSKVTVEQWRDKHNSVAEENFSLKEEISELRQKLKTKSILDDMLKPYAGYAYKFMCSYSAFVGIILLMNGFGCFKHPIADSVMQFLVGSTAVTVLGLVGMVLTGIFVGARK